MSRTLAVARRELLGLFKTPTALLFLVAFSALVSLVVVGQTRLFDRGQADLAPLFDALPWVGLLLLPAPAMGVLSEERRAGSIELLLTLPLSLGEVVVGKFLAALALATVALASTLPLWIAIASLGSPDHGAIAAAYVGALLLFAALLAIGVFVSALSTSPASAFVGAIAVGFLFLFSDIPAVRAVLPEALADNVARLSFAAHFEALARGVLGAADVLFFLATCATFLAATGLVLKARRHTRRAPLVPLFAGYVLVVPFVLPLTAGLRIDCTEGGLYSLSPGTRAILDGLEGDQTFTLYVGREAVAESPRFGGFVEFVEQELADFARASRGRIEVVVEDAAPFTPADDAARAARLARIPLGMAGRGRELVFGLVATNTAGDQRSLAFLSPENEGALEHEFARLALELDNPERKRVGVITSFTPDVAPGHPLSGGLTGRGWQSVENTRAQFDYVALETPLVRVPDVDVLWILHPKQLDETSLRAIDAYAQSGGNLLVMVDPLSEVDQDGMDPEDYTSGFTAPRESDLRALLEAWGVTLQARVVLADRTLGRELPAGAAGNTTPLTIPHWVTLDAEHVLPGAVAQSLLGGLDEVRFSSVGNLVVEPAEGLMARPVLATSSDSMVMDVSLVQVVRDPALLLRDFVASGTRHTFGVDLVGLAPPAFQGQATEHLGTSPLAPPTSPVADPAPMRALVVADVDWAADLLWVQVGDGEDPLAGRARAIASNGPLLGRMLADLAGGADLALAASPRESARYTRPFTRLVELERAAEERLARELTAAQALERELSGALVEAAEAFDGRDDAVAQGEINRITAELKLARQELAALERDRNAEVEALKTKWRRLTTLAFPALYLLVALGLRLRR